MERIRRSDLEGTLRRIAVGARLLGMAWFVLLGLVALLQQGDRIERPEWVVGPLGAAVVWGLVSPWVARRGEATGLPALLVDLALGSVALVAPNLAGVPDVLFYGGLPLIVVAVASIRGPREAWAAAGILVAVVLAKAPGTQVPDILVTSVSQVLTYLAGAFIFSWTVRVLRLGETERRLVAESAVRAEERAEISRHLHDSVLQTLVLVQRAAGRPDEVVALARRQERDLREWLYGTPRPPDAGLSDGVRAAAAEVEDRYRVSVDVVTVGDAPMTPAVEALVAAAREAMVNSAKHSGSGLVSVYAEVRAGSATVFVRDRGDGFDPHAVPSDRRGIEESIEARLAAAGGRAELRAGLGRGVEWQLEVTV